MAAGMSASSANIVPCASDSSRIARSKRGRCPLGQARLLVESRYGLWQMEHGEYQYRIASSGFCPKNGTATIDTLWQQEIRAKLEVDRCPGPCAPPCVIPIGVDPPGSPVTVKVSDAIGAFVAGALVEIDPSPSSFRAIKTNGTGQADIGYPLARIYSALLLLDSAGGRVLQKRKARKK